MSVLAQEIRGEAEERAPFLLDSHPSMVTRSLAAGLSLFAGKWKLSILWYLEQRPRRFGELASLLPGVTPKVLTYQLRELEEGGLIARAETGPRQIHYTLTDQGTAAMPVLRLLWDWGNWRLRRVAADKRA